MKPSPIKNPAWKRGLATALVSSALGVGLTACSTATLIGATIDMASFVPPIARSQTVPLPAISSISLKPLDDKDGNPNNGFLISTPISGINIIEGFNAEVSLKLGSSSQTAVKLELFIAPETVSDIYQASYLVTSDDRTITAGGSENVTLKFDLQPNSASNSSATAGALSAIKSGKFRLGLNLGLQTTTLGSFTYTLNKAAAGVSGYPAKLIK
jgi:hypothetical protein